ncbi:MAG: hypothetical protein K9I69_03190 [Ignavibacteriales bacterium]|nr:hypothetical protein [Ignavibacteriales bacterium]MCF8306649.1 hypothetical protein [Ignavibacteriales bacterium]MCF8316251.1 hypothetical protein [Ignavibacteriales bacterium]MCF8437835.1 hypothetical protein [Ignavibacteriales bacterium]
MEDKKIIVFGQKYPDSILFNKYFSETEAYLKGSRSFIAGILPSDVISLPVGEVIFLLKLRFGSIVDDALRIEDAIPSMMFRGQLQTQGLFHQQNTTDWLKSSNIVGVNIRTIQSFINLVKYALTLNSLQNAIHILPVWEPGVLKSIYGIVSWNINEEFYSEEFCCENRFLNSPAKQLKATVNLLHIMGKAVGMDVIPHTDRFSEIALAYPDYFEWIKRKGKKILDKSSGIYRVVMLLIFDFIQKEGRASGEGDVPEKEEDIFGENVTESERNRILFGEPEDRENRLKRRLSIIRMLNRNGLETVPVTMAPPYRNIIVDENSTDKLIDEHGLEWWDYKMAHPSPMSRVFGPLTRYKFFEAKDDNKNWELDFDRPQVKVWEYFCTKYTQFQKEFDFDFMRGDMSHVQMRPEGIPKNPTSFYDPLKAVKTSVQISNNAPYFAYLAESFLAPDNVMAYGNEMEHLEESNADAVLGDLQSTALGSVEFAGVFSNYLGFMDKKTRPCFTVITSDKDDPRFDHFFMRGKAGRFFISQFLSNLPSYISLGFEIRDDHFHRVPNEYYSKLYVFQDNSGNNITNGPFRWGENINLFNGINRIKICAEELVGKISSLQVKWIKMPNRNDPEGLIGWMQDAPQPEYLFFVNLSLDECAFLSIGLVGMPSDIKSLRSYFSACLYDSNSETTKPNTFQDYRLCPGEYLILQAEYC